MSDGAFIPFDPANTDYQAFLKYQAEGGIVLNRYQGIVLTLGEQAGKTWLGCIVNTTDFQGVNEAIYTVCKCV